MNVELMKLNDYQKQDRNLENKIFVYCFIVGMFIVLLLLALNLVQKDLYYQNDLLVLDDNRVVTRILVRDLVILQGSDNLWINGKKYYYSIIGGDILEDPMYSKVILSIHNDLLVNSFNHYKILLKKESLLDYFIRVIKGE